MGVEYEAQVLVGFRVRHDDFWTGRIETIRLTEEALCASCKTQGEEGKYCSDCGYQFAYVEEERPIPTDGFKAYYERLVRGLRKEKAYVPEIAELWSVEDPGVSHSQWVEETASPKYLEDLEVFTDSDMGDDVAVAYLGVNVSGRADRETVQEAFEACQRFVDGMGLTKRQVFLWSSTRAF